MKQERHQRLSQQASSQQASAERLRAAILEGRHQPAQLHAALLAVPPGERDAWLDCVLGLHELPSDGPALPRGCAPYLPCPIDQVLEAISHAPIRASDVFVDVGAGLGRPSLLVHLITGATALGLEVQPHLADQARSLITRLGLTSVSILECDAAGPSLALAQGTVFFLYCPFSGARLATLLAALEHQARTRALRLCCVDLPLPACPWLRLESSPRAGLAIYRSLHMPP